MTRAEQQLPWDFHCPSTSTVTGPPLSQQLHCHMPSTSQDIRSQEVTLGGQWASAVGCEVEFWVRWVASIPAAAEPGKKDMAS